MQSITVSALDQLWGNRATEVIKAKVPAIRGQGPGILVMEKEFTQLPWHDAELISIRVDRTDPGINDQVILAISWPNGEFSEIIFSDCYGLKADLNFGVIASETIRCAVLLEKSKDLNNILQKWNRIGANIIGLKEFRFETNSTNSLIVIYAKKFTVIKSN